LTEAIRSVVDVLHQAAGTIDRVNGMLRRVDEMGLNTQNLQHVSSILAQVDVTSSNAVSLTASLQSIVNDSRASVSNTLGKLTLAVDNVNGVTKRVDGLVRDSEGEARAAIKNLAEGTQRLNRILERVEKGEGSIGKLLTDSSLHDELLQVARNLEQFGFFYNTWIGPRLNPKTGAKPAGQTPRQRPSTLEPPPGGVVPVPARPAKKE
jgi:phospholipid/cholesterol/gamma-HCH transport system substrate-binding protein